MSRIRRDRFYRARGGSAQLVRLVCGRCRTFLCVYQKDGMGNLLRIYWDRVSDLRDHAEYSPGATQDEMSPLLCDGCGHLLGVPMTYADEDRLAWRLERGAVHKTRRKK